MSEARAVILGRIAAALGDVPAAERPSDVAVARDYRRAPGEDAAPVVPEDRVARFAERVRDYHAEVRRVPAGDVGAAVSAACRERGLAHVAVPPELPDDWRPDGVRVTEDHALTARELDALDGAVTGCAVAIAETGTLVLDATERCGRRVLTLVPDHHICIVQAIQIADRVPEALAAVADAAVGRRLPVTLISGPSASSDIELERVEGVHGPRHLLVVIADPSTA